MNDGTFSAGYIRRTIVEPIAVWKPAEEVVEEPIPTPPAPPLPSPPAVEYIVIAGQEIYKPTLMGEDAEGDWWAVWNDVRYWIRDWTMVQSMQEQGVPQGDVSPYPMPGTDKYFESIAPFPGELLYVPIPSVPPATPVLAIKLGDYIPWIFAGLSLGGFLIAVGTKGRSK